jgi:hypothetical protein
MFNSTPPHTVLTVLDIIRTRAGRDNFQDSRPHEDQQTCHKQRYVAVSKCRQRKGVNLSLQVCRSSQPARVASYHRIAYSFDYAMDLYSVLHKANVQHKANVTSCERKVALPSRHQ